MTTPSMLQAQAQAQAPVSSTSPLCTASRPAKLKMDLSFRDRFLVQSKLIDALYGPILKCEDTIDDSHAIVAVKLISLVRRQALTDHGRIVTDNPIQEQWTIRRLQATRGHPNVLQYHQIYEEEHGRVLVFVMEFCPHGDLQQLMTRLPQQHFDEPLALDYFHQILSGVQFLHRHGIAHRDLSLENVLITQDGICKVCDFGLSVPASQHCVGPVGKHYYMAPEVVAGKVYDPVQADIWSLGIMLFIMMTGYPLLKLATPDDLTLEIIERCGVKQMLDLWHIDELVSPFALDLMNRMLRVQPSERSGVDELVQLLEMR